MLPEAVASGQEALDAVGQGRTEGRPFAIFVLDVTMPGMDGFDLVEEIRRYASLLQTVTVFSVGMLLGPYKIERKIGEGGM